MLYLQSKKENVIPYIKGRLFLSVYGLQGVASYDVLYKGAITRNISYLYPFSLLKGYPILKNILFVIVLLLMNIRWKKSKYSYMYLLLFLLALTPYIRYLLLANHSFRHFFFTYRDQMITIISLIAMMIINKEEDLNNNKTNIKK